MQKLKEPFFRARYLQKRNQKLRMRTSSHSPEKQIVIDKNSVGIRTLLGSKNMPQRKHETVSPRNASRQTNASKLSLNLEKKIAPVTSDYQIYNTKSVFVFANKSKQSSARSKTNQTSAFPFRSQDAPLFEAEVFTGRKISSPRKLHSRNDFKMRKISSSLSCRSQNHGQSCENNPYRHVEPWQNQNEEDAHFLLYS